MVQRSIVLLGVVIDKCELLSPYIVQDNKHALLMVKRQFGTSTSDKEQ